jgi:hypothetical protein
MAGHHGNAGHHHHHLLLSLVLLLLLHACLSYAPPWCGGPGKHTQAV